MNRPTPFSPSLRQVKAFVAVYQLRKLTSAAQRLNVTQSAVSVMLRELEEGLGCQLFDRTTRSLQPTPAAAEALVLCERILRDLEALGTGFRELSQLRRGRVKIAVTPALAAIVLPSVVTRFAREHPGIHVAVDDCAPDQFVARVMREDVDFGIGAPERAAVDVDVATLVQDPLAVVCRSDHPLARLRSPRWKDLAGVPVITVRPGYGIRPLIDAAAARAGVHLEVTHEISFLSTALWMARCGMGVSIMPASYARAAEDLLPRKLREPVVSRNTMLVTKRGRSLSPAAQALVAVIRAELAQS